MVETPARRSTRRKPQFQIESDGESSSAAETVLQPPKASLRKRAAKFTEHLEEDALMMQPTPPKTPENDETSPLLQNGHSKPNGNVVREERLIDGWKPGMDPKVDACGAGSARRATRAGEDAQ